MCGIVGLVTKLQQGFYYADVNLFSQMLIADSLRGTDGTGIFGTYGKGSVGWLKVGAHPYALLTNPKYESWTTAMVRKMDMVVGHNRKATAGSTSNENSHPFVQDHIILVHNGMVLNHKSMAKTEVDSHAIAHSMVDKGHIETLATLEGAFALVWFDMKDRVLRLIRNSQRPLYMVETDTHIAFASEGSMLDWIGSRNDKDWKTIKLIEEGTLVSIAQSNKSVTTEKISLYTPKNTFSYPFNVDYEAYCSGASTQQKDIIALSEITSDESDIVHEEDQVTRLIQNDFPDEKDAKEVADFINEYTDGTVILFEPWKLIPWAHTALNKGWTLEGTVRGQPDISVKASFEGLSSYQYLSELKKKSVLKGTVYGASINPTNYKKTISVSHVTSLNMYRTFNGSVLTSEEWIGICNTYPCLKCGASLKISDIEGTSINLANKNRPRIFCPTCVLKHIRTLPPEQKEQLAKFNNTPKKDWNLKGATHGS